MTEVLDNFHIPPAMVMAAWADFGNYPILESLTDIPPENSGKTE